MRMVMTIATRLEFARQLDKLRNSDISIDEFEEEYFSLTKGMKKDDLDLLLIQDIFFQVWHLYDDFSDDYLQIDEEINSDINRYICFLASNKKCEWPILEGILTTFLTFFTFGYYNKIRRKQLKKFGDLNAWPFISIQEYQNCREKNCREKNEGKE
ncbi:MAG TPA: hypothetical protein ENL10_01800 [Candidatus Cloacimonetes bacterium]|nr:hypothetical protein [Candidatus Cloacimonadota bacterium]